MIQPTLTLNFARTGQLDRRVNFSRSSTGVYTGYDGILKYAGIAEPRFDYDASGNSLGLLIEAQRTNRKTYSDFIGGGWDVTNTTVSVESHTAPDGSAQTAKAVPTTDEVSHSVYIRSNTIYTDEPICGSVYLKSAGYPIGRFHVQGAGRVWFDLSTGQMETLTVEAADFSYSMHPIGDDWHRIILSGTSPETSTIGYFIVGVYPDGGFTNPGDGTSGLYVWGAQIEAALDASSYIPTTSATVTRTADSAEISGDPFASWIHTEGTLLAKYRDAGWLYNDTPPTDSLDLTKYIDDYSTSAAGDTIESVIFYPRTLTATQRGVIML